jgi:hypothetical protein
LTFEHITETAIAHKPVAVRNSEIKEPEMIRDLYCVYRTGLIAIAFVAASAGQARADEIWVAPTSQADIGGLGVASNVFWPVTPIGAVRLAFPIPVDLKTLQTAKVVLIPTVSSASTLNLYVCSALDGTMAGAACQGPFSHSFTGVANQLREVDISSSLAGSLGSPFARPYLAVLAYTSPTTTTDHMVGLRFTYGQSVLTLATSSNTGLGIDSFRQGSTGSNNTALGSGTMLFPVNGSNNTAVGQNAMFGNGGTISGNENTAVGVRALSQVSSGSQNVAIGVGASQELHADGLSTAVGYDALFVGAPYSTAVGAQALANNNEANNAAVGYGAMGVLSGAENTAIGALAMGGTSTFLSNSIRNIAIGYRAGFNVASGDYNIYIGHEGQEEWNTVRLGTPFNATDQSGQNRVFLAGVRGITTGAAGAVPVVIDSNGQLGTISSSRRFKEDIQPMADSSRRLFDLHPVTFRYSKSYANGVKPVQFGLVAEEVAQAFPELAVLDANGNVETVHYETLNVLLLNEVQRQEHRIEQLEWQLKELLERR